MYQDSLYNWGSTDAKVANIEIHLFAPRNTVLQSIKQRKEVLSDDINLSAHTYVFASCSATYDVANKNEWIKKNIANIERVESNEKCLLVSTIDDQVYALGFEREADLNWLNQIPRLLHIPTNDLRLKRRVIQITLGHNHALILTSENCSSNSSGSGGSSSCSCNNSHNNNCVLYSSGSGKYGQLGIGNQRVDWMDSFVPVCLNVIDENNNNSNSHQEYKENTHQISVKYIAAGNHCSALISTTGALYTFGSGAYYRLGHGNNHDCLLPTRVEALEHVGDQLPTGESTGVCRVACGLWHMVAISSDTHDVYGWGWNKFNQLGLRARHGQHTYFHRNKRITTSVHDINNNNYSYDVSHNDVYNSNNDINNKNISINNNNKFVNNRSNDDDDDDDDNEVVSYPRRLSFLGTIESLEPGGGGENDDDDDEFMATEVCCGSRHTALVSHDKQRVVIMGVLGTHSQNNDDDDDDFSKPRIVLDLRYYHHHHHHHHHEHHHGNTDDKYDDSLNQQINDRNDGSEYEVIINNNNNNNSKDEEDNYYDDDNNKDEEDNDDDDDDDNNNNNNKDENDNDDDDDDDQQQHTTLLQKRRKVELAAPKRVSHSSHDDACSIDIASARNSCSCNNNNNNDNGSSSSSSCCCCNNSSGSSSCDNNNSSSSISSSNDSSSCSCNNNNNNNSSSNMNGSSYRSSSRNNNNNNSSSSNTNSINVSKLKGNHAVTSIRSSLWKLTITVSADE